MASVAGSKGGIRGSGLRGRLVELRMPRLNPVLEGIPEDFQIIPETTPPINDFGNPDYSGSYSSGSENPLYR